MIEFIDSHPEVNVEPAEYQRLLGYPPGHTPSDRARELAEWARGWYQERGNPWIYGRRAESLEMDGASLRVDGEEFHCAPLQRTLREAQAEVLYVVAVGAGPEAEMEAQRLWQEEKPDEYFFLEVYGSAVVEALIAMAGARLCAWADSHGMAVLTHYSPGYSEWDIAEQGRLVRVLKQGGTLPGPLEALESGALRPKKSLAGIFGVTPHVDLAGRLAGMVPCEQCLLAGCQYRRTPYRRARRSESPTYTVSPKALKKWAAERLTLEGAADGSVFARFLYEGTTCTNMGRPLAFLYEVTLGPPEDGRPIRNQYCSPAAGDTGHAAMCEYIRNPQNLLASISGERPLLGMPLGSALTWHRAASGAGCYCDAESRAHKWGLVLETIHYALHTDQINGNEQ